MKVPMNSDIGSLMACRILGQRSPAFWGFAREMSSAEGARFIGAPVSWYGDVGEPSEVPSELTRLCSIWM